MSGVRRWLYKTDESGRPRRFVSPREALGWAALRVGWYAGPPFWLYVIAVVFDPRGLGRWELASIGLLLLTLWAVVVAVMWVYVVLSGGVMDGEEQRVYHERLRESWRGRW